ncbi:MAG TPA: hypothetical protein VFF54_00380 [Thermodesulfobacteriota bacterium]|nr:hypothetical protein [Thermodesulfobacteriota bacterium]
MSASTDKKPFIKTCLGKPSEFNFRIGAPASTPCGANISYENKALKMTEAA